MNLDDMRGEWALVTGASSGIGYAYATELARKGLNLILVARRKDRLTTLSQRLTEMFGTQAVIVIEDLGIPGAAGQIAHLVAS